MVWDDDDGERCEYGTVQRYDGDGIFIIRYDFLLEQSDPDVFELFYGPGSVTWELPP